MMDTIQIHCQKADINAHQVNDLETENCLCWKCGQNQEQEKYSQNCNSEPNLQ